MNGKGGGEKWKNLKDLGGKRTGPGDGWNMKEWVKGVEGDTQVSSLQRECHSLI